MEKGLIQKLQKAGVDAQTILALILDDEQPAPEAETQDPPANEQPANEQPAEQPEQQAQPEVQAAVTDPILAAINKLTGAIQASNIINSGAQGRPQAVTVDDVMAKIIQPQAPGKE